MGSSMSAETVPSSASRTNWAGNYQYRADHLFYPRTLPELQQLVRDSPHAKALGTRHSFQEIADTAGAQIALDHFDDLALAPAAAQVTLGGGVRYGQLALWLHQRGFALHNLASLPHISVAGACSTGTHGSGICNGSLSTAVAALEFVTATGEIVSLSRDLHPEAFPGAVVALGALGIVTRLTLDVQPAFTVRQLVYCDLPFAVLEDHLLEILSAGYSVSLFTDWQQSRVTQLWLKERLEPGTAPSAPAPEFYGASLADVRLHPIAGHDPIHCTEQLGIPGPWHERLPHFRMEFTPSSGAELQSEYFVPLEQGYRALRAVEALRDRIAPHLLVTELRAVAADDLWLSPSYRRASFAIHFTWKRDWPAVQHILPLIEAQLAPFAPRPHWAKLFTLPPARVLATYDRLPDFLALVQQHDPRGKFRNDFLHRYLFPAGR
jgi:alditol oxidase